VRLPAAQPAQAAGAQAAWIEQHAQRDAVERGPGVLVILAGQFRAAQPA